MPHIKVPDDVPGIRSLVMFRPDTGRHLYELAEVLLRGESPLTPAERELIAAYVSRRNACVFCSCSHAAASRVHFGDAEAVVDAVLTNPETAPISAKFRALLVIADKTRERGNLVTADHIAAARDEGATDREIHDTVLIAASFSMFNRYVDGLDTLTPTDPAAYAPMGVRMATVGYVPPEPARE
ncbi:MAG TPA: peroxidase-related enzyme [Chryseolinea sp.]|nr:peroxidase-related enzyme [Chryseolinea sp.]